MMEQPNSQQQPNGQQNNLYLILGWVFAGLSLIFIPLLFGAGAFVMGFLTKKQPGRETHGVIIMVFAVAACVLGMIIGAAFGASGY